VRQPLRVLHVVGAMNRGGVETWLMNVLRRIDRRDFHLDFLVSTDRTAVYDEEVRSMGCQIIPCLHHDRPWIYARNFSRALRRHGPYDIVHSHVERYSGFVLLLSHRAGVPVRIAHSHSSRLLIQPEASLARRAYLGLMSRWIGRHATLGLALTDQAAASLYGMNWRKDPRWRVLLCGIDTARFQIAVNAAAVRQSLGLPPGTLNIMHTGTFVEVKNHSFILDVAQEITRREPNSRFILVGDGPLRAAMEQKVARLGLSGHVLFTGVRADVQRLLLGAADVFVFPSRSEGLGQALVEAQAAGVPCVCSDHIPREAEVVQPLVRRLSLSLPASVWADALLASARRGPGVTRAEALDRVSRNFNTQSSVDELARLYAEPHPC